MQHVIWPNHINNEPILTRSMLAAGTCLLEKLEKAREAKRRRLEATSTAQARLFHSTSTSIAKHSHAHVYQKLTYIYIYRVSIDIIRGARFARLIRKIEQASSSLKYYSEMHLIKF